jgi:hypothetical protein
VSAAMNTEGAETAAEARLIEARDKDVPWKLWGPYLSRMPELRDAVHATGPGHFRVAERGMIGATISYSTNSSMATTAPALVPAIRREMDRCRREHN